MLAGIGFRSNTATQGEMEPAWRGSRYLIALLALMLGLLTVPDAADAAGELDPTFDGDGKVTTDFFGGDDFGNDVAIQADGKLVVVGGGGESGRFELARYKLDGSLDPSFGGDGKVVAHFGGEEEAGDVAIQADGKIVAAGRSSVGPNPSNFALARYNPDGSLDSSFDGDGLVVTDFGAFESIVSVTIQADGKIVAAGLSGPLDGFNDFALARYNANGSLDSNFDGDGRLTADFGSEDYATGVAVQADDRIVAAGVTSAGPEGLNFALARYNPNGSPDPSFGGDGRVAIDFGGGEAANALAIQADGKIVAAGVSFVGFSGGNFALARYRVDGSPDPSFGGDGHVTTDFGQDDRAIDVTIQPDGKLLAAGHDGQVDFALARYNANGSLDSSFDGDGRVLTDFGAIDIAAGVGIQLDGKIVAAGLTATNNPADFAIARYLSGLPPPPRISINDVRGFEGNAGVSAFSFTVRLSSPSAQTVTVIRRTVNGSAGAPEDFSALGPATITFAPGETTKTVTVEVKADVVIEPNEAFFVNLSYPTNAVITDGRGSGTIVNDDLSASSACTIIGTGGSDVLTGTPGNDVICGGNGDDQLFGVDGGDVLKGQNGNDLLVGGNGVDLLVGGTGSDDLRGETGNDTLRSGDGDDTLNGGADSDALFGEGGSDSLDSQDGISANDSADGGNGSDTCVIDSGDFVTSCP
jgi:uncharacterized delta-60 repeat protein